MKKHIYLLFAVVLAGGLGSCKDALDLPDDGRISYESIWSDRNRTMGYLNTCYAYRPTEFTNIATYTGDGHSVTDNSVYSNATYYYMGSFGADMWGLPSNWSAYFYGIRYCNVFIQALPTATAYAQPDEKEGWLAQAKCLRAFYYLMLIRDYGGVPLITEPYDFEHDFSKDRRAKVWEVVQQILKDTQEALAAAGAEDMSYAAKGFRWVGGDNYGPMMTRAVAYAIRSQAIMLAVSPLHASEEGNPYTWNDAAEITKESLDQCLSHDYSLFDRLPLQRSDANNSYDYLFFTEFDWERPVDKETIYQLDNPYINVFLGNGLPTNPKQSSAGMCPTQELVDCYETADGYPILLEDSKGNKYSDDNHLQPKINPASGYSDKNPYINRDPRFYGSIYYNGAQRHWDDEFDLVRIYSNDQSDSSCKISKTLVRYTRTGYYLRKFNKHDASYEKPVNGQMRLFRLAELYLNFAEAANESDYGPQGQVKGYSNQGPMSAVAAVNKVRTRAGMPDVRSEYTGDRDAFRLRIRNERRVEFAFEPLRFYDTRRWKILDQDNMITGMEAIKNADDTYSYSRFVVYERKVPDAYLLYPLPVSEVNKMYKQTGTNWQNPGYQAPE